MNRRVFFLLFSSITFLLIFNYPALNQEKNPKNLPRKYQKWLEEEVVYIITPKEKEVFLQLETDKERDLFIKAFWKHRDPNPNTPENEFKKEHYRRINYANQWFGKSSPGPGWRTARGRMYIKLGEPKTIDRHENMSRVYPVIIWFYEGMEEYGLPNAFNVVFFKRKGIGEYELYSPVKFGPQSLLIHYKGDPADYLAAYNKLLNIEPQIAEVSLTLLPEETSYRALSPSMSSEILISEKVKTAPYKRVKDTYAEKLLKYKDIIEVDYTANYMSNDSTVKIIRGLSGIFFVHLLMEPKKLSLEKLPEKFHTTLRVNVMVSDLKGQTIFQYERSIPVEFSSEELNHIQNKLFSFQEIFPLVEGNYKLNVLLKNTVSKEFTSLEKEITIPPSSSFQMSSLVLANRIVKNSKYKGKIKPFLIEGTQLVPSPRNDFTSKDDLFLFFQIYSLSPKLKEKGRFEFVIFNQDEKVYSEIKHLKDYSQNFNFLEPFSLDEFSPGHYRIQVSLLNENREKVLSEDTYFVISPVSSLPRPWTLSIPMPSFEHPMYPNILGTQLLNKKEFSQAQTLLEKAYIKDPQSVKFALDYIQALLNTKNYRKVKQVASPFLKNQQRDKFLKSMGKSCQALGEWEKAITYYKEYLSHSGTNLIILNSIGECYYQLGNNKEALTAWKKSLEINPNQEKIKNKIQSIKSKK